MFHELGLKLNKPIQVIIIINKRIIKNKYFQLQNMGFVHINFLK